MQAKRHKTELAESGDTEKQQKQAWSKLMAKAKGEKVIDDIDTLKRRVKKEEYKKKKSAKAW